MRCSTWYGIQATARTVRQPSRYSTEPTVIGRSHHSVDVVHKIIDPDQEALEELRALRALNTPRDKLLEIYGHNGLDGIEALEAAENSRRTMAAKLIDGRAIKTELEPAGGR